MPKSLRPDIYLALAALVLVCSSPARAQWSGSGTPGFGHGLRAVALSQGNLTLGRNALRNRAARQNGNASSAHAQGPRDQGARDVAMRYRPDPLLTEKIRVSMIDLASQNNPDSRPQWERLMADDAILREFDNLMGA